MQEIMQIIAQGMSADIDRMSTVGMNITNARTPSYKRAISAGEIFDRMVDRADMSAAGARVVASVAAHMPTVSDMRPGKLIQTGRPLDVALTGPYFFELTADSGPVYSRMGSFQLNAQGTLIGASGYPVMGMGGEIQLGGGTPTIDAQGNIYENGRLIDRLKLVHVKYPEKMARLGDGLYDLAGQSTDPADNGATALQQGYLEASNVDAGREMVSVMEIARHFETMQKVAQSYDDMTTQAIQKLGNL